MEVAEGKDVRLAEGGVVPHERIRDARIAIVRILVAGSEVKFGILVPCSFLTVLIQVGEKAELDHMVTQNLGYVIRRHHGVAGGGPARRKRD